MSRAVLYDALTLQSMLTHVMRSGTIHTLHLRVDMRQAAPAHDVAPAILLLLCLLHMHLANTLGHPLALSLHRPVTPSRHRLQLPRIGRLQLAHVAQSGRTCMYVLCFEIGNEHTPWPASNKVGA